MDIRRATEGSHPTKQSIEPVHGQHDTFAEQQMHPSTQQNNVLNLSMNILKTFRSKEASTPTRWSLRPLDGRRNSFRE
ncbi:hypothetical protein TNCT_396561 [Trichonephila clavata]|uniref:Uncharacterized protein n=1 Tax=Trichonephila clavata TaxID=2740835 RepID=A0A8X6JIG2_TRICU|nr:hypothetical protein TNCT_396561 [Trichonephila clavata]